MKRPPHPPTLADREHRIHSPLLITTDAGTVLKVISVPKGSRPNAEGLLLEELHVFEVRGLTLSSPLLSPGVPPLHSADPSGPSFIQDSAAVTSMQISSKRVSDRKP